MTYEELIEELKEQLALLKEETGKRREKSEEREKRIHKLEELTRKVEAETAIKDAEWKKEWSQYKREAAHREKELRRKYEHWGIVAGDIAEDFFRRNAKDVLTKNGIKVDSLYPNFREKGSREYDIVAFNEKEVIIFEIKNKLRHDDIEKFVNVQLPRFKKEYPEYKERRVYGALGSLVFKDHLEGEALKKGVFVMTQGSNHLAELHKPKKLVTF